MKTKRRSTPSRVSELFNKRAFDRLGLGLLLKEYLTKKAWTKAVGEKLAQKSRPTRLIKKKLYVEASSPAWTNELRYHKEEIIEKLNAEAGPGTVSDIIFKTGEVKKPIEIKPTKIKQLRDLTKEEIKIIEETVSNINDQDIKGAIMRAMKLSKQNS